MTTATPIRPGELALRVVADGTGRTRIADLRQRYPQRITTALHCDPCYPGAAVVCVQNPSGGTFSDDELSTTVDAETGTHLRLTTQGATQVFAGAGGGSRHRVRIRVGPGSVVEYLPRTMIPHRDCSYTQHLDIALSPTGTYLGWDAVAGGRLGHGERFAYRRVDGTIRVSVAGRVVVRDRQLIEPPAARLIGADYLVTMLMLAPWADGDRLLRAVRATLERVDVRAGASDLPHGAGVIVRLVTDRATELPQLQAELARSAREVLVDGGSGTT